MELYLLRHGEAQKRFQREEKAAAAYPDDRPLTKSGRKKLEESADAYGIYLGDVDGIISSPLSRAAETAVSIRDIIGLELDIEESETLLPDASPEPAVSLIRGFFFGSPKKKSDEPAQGSDLLLVGHEPNLSLLIAHLVGAPRPFTELKKGGLAKLFVPNEPGGISGGCELRWLVTPRQLRMLSVLI